MKTLFKFAVLFISFTSVGQLSGVDEYQVTDRLDFTSDKQYIISEETYDFQIQDAYDNKISVKSFDLVWDEMFRIMEENGVTDVIPFVLHGSKELQPTYKSIISEIKHGCNFIVIRYDMGNGYFAYLNLQDGFCGMAITKEKID